MTSLRIKLITHHITLFLLLSLSAHSQSDAILKAYTDSVEHIISTTEGKNKIRVMDSLAQYMNFQQGGLQYINMLEKEALQQSDKQMLGNAYFYKANYNFFMVRALDSTLFYLNTNKLIVNSALAVF